MKELPEQRVFRDDAQLAPCRYATQKNASERPVIEAQLRFVVTSIIPQSMLPYHTSHCTMHYHMEMELVIL